MNRFTLLLCELIQEDLLNAERILLEPDTVQILFESLIRQLVLSDPLLRLLPVDRVLSCLDWDMVLIAAAIKKMDNERSFAEPI
jgi:hypothetical protein